MGRGILALRGCDPVFCTAVRCELKFEAAVVPLARAGGTCAHDTGGGCPGSKQNFVVGFLWRAGVASVVLVCIFLVFHVFVSCFFFCLPDRGGLPSDSRLHARKQANIVVVCGGGGMGVTCRSSCFASGEMYMLFVYKRIDAVVTAALAPAISIQPAENMVCCCPPPLQESRKLLVCWCAAFWILSNGVPLLDLESFCCVFVASVKYVGLLVFRGCCCIQPQ